MYSCCNCKLGKGCIDTYMTCQKEGKVKGREGKEVQSSKPVFLVVCSAVVHLKRASHQHCQRYCRVIARHANATTMHMSARGSRNVALDHRLHQPHSYR